MSVRLDVEWDTCDPATWQGYMRRIPKSNIIQTIPYAHVMRAVSQQMTRFGVIKEEGRVIGCVQIQEIRLLKFIHFVFLDRGPLWLPGEDTPAHHKAFFTWFQKTFPRRFGRRRRILPEITISNDDANFFEGLGYQRAGEGYQSIWMDLTPDMDVLRAALKQKWRHGLNKAERQDLVIEEDPFGAQLTWLIHVYAKDKKDKNYPGAPPVFVKSLFMHFAKRGQVIFLRAIKDNSPVAAIVIFLHGTSATYQLGWSDEQGRAANAHYALLWHAIKILKDKNVRWFDLGGINTESAAGVTQFKTGLGGTMYELVGIYR